MINLIPNEEKKKMAKDFYFRLLVVFLFVLGSCIMIAFISIMPSYVLSSAKENLAKQKLAAQNLKPDTDVNQTTVADLTNQLTIVENAEKNKYLLSQKVVNEILLNKMPDIKISDIAYQNDSTTGKTIHIRGIAPSRDRLLSFRQALQNDANFKNVNLPISNFVKGTDIEFDLSVTPS